MAIEQHQTPLEAILLQTLRLDKTSTSWIGDKLSKFYQQQSSLNGQSPWQLFRINRSEASEASHILGQQESKKGTTGFVLGIYRQKIHQITVFNESPGEFCWITKAGMGREKHNRINFKKGESVQGSDTENIFAQMLMQQEIFLEEIQ